MDGGGDVTLTPTGHDLVERLVDRVLGREAELVSGLTDDQRAALTTLLRVLLDHLHAEIGPRRPSQVGSDPA